MPDRFRNEWIVNEDGTFVTEQELRFFQARPNGLSMIESNSEEFKTYINKCRVHNFLYELDKDCGYFYWDTATGSALFMIHDYSIVDTLEGLGLLEYVKLDINE